MSIRSKRAATLIGAAVSVASMMSAGAAMAQAPDIFVSTFYIEAGAHQACVDIMREECNAYFGKCQQSSRGAFSKIGPNTVFLDCVDYETQIVAVFAGATSGDSSDYDRIRDASRALNDAVYERLR